MLQHWQSMIQAAEQMKNLSIQIWPPRSFSLAYTFQRHYAKKHFSIKLNYWDLFKLQQLEEIEIIINRKTFFSCTERRSNLINELFCPCCIMICRIFPFHISLHICKCALTILRNQFLGFCSCSFLMEVCDHQLTGIQIVSFIHSLISTRHAVPPILRLKRN